MLHFSVMLLSVALNVKFKPETIFITAEGES